MIRALVPAKGLAEAKGRLAEALTHAERRELALAMIEDVLRALTSVPAIDGVSVVSPDKDVSTLAVELGAHPIAESASVGGLNQALLRALSSMSPQPEALLIVLGDLPEITPEAIEELLAALPERGVAASPASDGGTSAMALRPPRVILFRFGEGSFAAHRAESETAGVVFNEVRITGLQLDVDSPADLRELASRSGHTATHRLLQRLGLERRAGA